jgi:branched-chain amino acid transport system permease protein
MVTLSFGETIRFVIANEEWLTGGVQSLTGIRQPLGDVITFNYDIFFLVVVAGTVFGVYLLVQYLSESPFGRVLHGIREDEDVLQALGKDTTKFKLKSFALGAAIAGLAGGLWAIYLRALTPGMFTPTVLFFVWAAVIVGGSGSHVGAIGGAIIIIGMQQVTRFLPQDIPFADIIPHVRVILIGLILIGILYFRPYGIWGDKNRMAAGDTEGGTS